MDCIFDCNEFNFYRIDLPYPDVIVKEPDSYYASIISGAYAGRGSESTAIAQYSSHRFFTEEYPDVYNAYKYIAAVEMIHFSLLGSLIKRLGTNPALFSYETNRYWNGDYPEYRYTLNEILKADIEGERGAVAHYTRMTGQINDESIQSLFKRIILDERRHIEILESFYTKYK